MQFTKEDLHNLSELSRITVQEGKEEKMLSDMRAILQYVSEINSVEGSVLGREITAKRDGHYNVVREDVISHESGSHTVAILQEAPDKEDGYVKVSQVFK